MKNKIKVCITGATGFIGSNLLKSLEGNEGIEVIALSRKISSMMNGAKVKNVTWRRCNAFSSREVVEATKDVDIIVYLIHSMLPSSTLTQGSFSDFDLLLADNFARAAHKNNVKKIIYLSGLIPKEDHLSAHLLSRLEVEKVLAQFNNNVITLRSGLIVGKDGSSFKILERLINRLPILVCPTWTKNKTQPIDVKDVLLLLKHSIINDIPIAAYDIGSNNIMTYKEMLILTSQMLGKKRLIFNFAYITPGLSKLWISKITSSSKSLVYPLVESLKHEMLVDNTKRLALPEGETYKDFKESLKEAISIKDQPLMSSIINYNAYINFRFLENVTSVQRVCPPKSKSALETSQIYFSWLPKVLFPLIILKRENDIVSFRLFNLLVLLKLKFDALKSNDDHAIYYIDGGILARKNTLHGRMAFRYIPALDCILISLLDFRPSVPWFIYKYTQAIMHLFVMNKFKTFMRKRYE